MNGNGWRSKSVSVMSHNTPWPATGCARSSTRAELMRSM